MMGVIIWHTFEQQFLDCNLKLLYINAFRLAFRLGSFVLCACIMEDSDEAADVR